MASLKEVRSRIASIKSTRKITSAMKMVSASKLRRAQNSITNLRPYIQKLKTTVDNIAEQYPLNQHNSYCRPNQSKKVLVISVASNKGLCGTYNTMLIKRTLDHLRILEKENTAFELFLIGKKTEEYFRNRDFIINNVNHEILEMVTYDNASTLTSELMEQYSKGYFGRVDVIYNYFKNAIMQELVVEQILPVPLPEASENSSDPGLKSFSGPIFEPSADEVIDLIIPKYIKTSFYRVMLDASASEHGARMTAMHKATDNATELLKNLTLSYNKVRQSLITREIMEIVAGAEVMQQ